MPLVMFFATNLSSDYFFAFIAFVTSRASSGVIYENFSLTLFSPFSIFIFLYTARSDTSSSDLSRESSFMGSLSFLGILRTPDYLGV